MMHSPSNTPPPPPSPPPDSCLLLKKPKSSSFSAARRQRTCLLLAILSLELLFLLSPHHSPLRRHRPLITTTRPSCPSGLVYVYDDLPQSFNQALLDSCGSLTRWGSPCAAVSNGGLGPYISTGLAGVTPDNLLYSWHSTDQFSAELIFHRRLLSHPCRTLNPTYASAFYVPFYAGLAVGRHLFSPNSTAADRDRDAAALLRWLQSRPPWIRAGGSDHFITLGRITWDFRRRTADGWGSSFLHMPGMARVTRLVIERNPWDERDVGIPYPTGFHPRSAGEVRSWQQFALNRNRSTLFAFAGSARTGFSDDFRGLLLGECARAHESGECRAVACEGAGKCGDREGEAVKLFLDAKFCLQPRGDSYTRRSMFDCMVAGAVPVVFWRRSAYGQYGWYLPEGEGEGEWSVFIDGRRVRRGMVSVREVLEGIGEERVRRMRERVVEMIPRLVYAGVVDGLGEGMEDAFDVAVNGVLRRFRERAGRKGR